MPSPCPDTPTIRPYDLGASGPRNPFPEVLRDFADAFLERSETLAGDLLDAHMAYLAAGCGDPPRSRGEYAVELLSLGVLRQEYGPVAMRAADELVRTMAELWRIRSEDRARKGEVDALRGRLFAEQVGESGVVTESVCDRKLVGWLEATGEFVQEAARLRWWLASAEMAGEDLLREASSALAAWFVPEARARLGAWTRGVDPFRERVIACGEPREDLFLITRPESLYHLNMVGSEVMNRGFLPGYLRRPERVVLVPGCMRSRDDEFCRARRDGLDITCARCHPDCEVAALDRLAEERGFRLRVVPHASTFTAWLRHWRREPAASLVAVACPLHLVTGGYEMRALGLEAQCVLLQYSGCRRHWDPDGVPTRVDRERLLEVVGG